jgi:hypothetical protein
MKAFRNVYRQEFLQPLLVALFLFQVGSGVSLATHARVRPIDRFRTFQIARGIFLAAHVLRHMNSVFVVARLYLGIDSGWASQQARRPGWLRTHGISALCRATAWACSSCCRISPLERA